MVEFDLFGSYTSDEVSILSNRSAHISSSVTSLRQTALTSPDIHAISIKGSELRRKLYITDTLRRKSLRTTISQVWSEEECQRILHGIDKVQWDHDRHSAFPTTDIQVNQLNENDLSEFVHASIKKRVFPILAKRMGMFLEDLIFADLFFVCYNADIENSRVGLDLHSDGCLVSFNILVSHVRHFPFISFHYFHYI